jgi:hypothetical protein
VLQSSVKHDYRVWSISSAYQQVPRRYGYAEWERNVYAETTSPSMADTDWRVPRCLRTQTREFWHCPGYEPARGFTPKFFVVGRLARGCARWGWFRLIVRFRWRPFTLGLLPAALVIQECC